MAHLVSKTGFPNIPLKPGMIIRLEARDPTTDAAVADVTSARWSIWGRDKSPEDTGLDVVPPFTLEESG